MWDEIGSDRTLRTLLILISVLVMLLMAGTAYLLRCVL